jgi:hypothetical protein
MKKSKYLILFLIAIGVGFVIFHAQAASILNPGLISEASCPKGGTCSLNTFLKLGISVATYILGIVGALTLLMFVYGGVTMIISGGSADKVKKGKDIIIGSGVGLMIVFGSYLIVSFVARVFLKHHKSFYCATVSVGSTGCAKTFLNSFMISVPCFGTERTTAAEVFVALSASRPCGL